ncbi:MULTISPECIES: FecR/PupR family sigma factor regulator [Herbaspirillum]|uniref:FecR/PupR family sigma factor regulator n=1 Tax=Herbaspirillum TaxID=963 RepID=UPI0009E93FBC|nr:DUF4880 domain-containing protein [Herbaspirillum rubrisubalbicans]
MNDTHSLNQTACREAAWYWIQRQHEAGPHDRDVAAALQDWLQADPTHQAAYQEAARIWAVAGLVAPSRSSS